MTAYIVVDAQLKDTRQFLKYRELAQLAVAQYGGRYIVRGGACTVLEGDWQPGRLVIVEFPSTEQARLFYDSPEYLAARAARAEAADFDMLLVEGI
ncbi:MAG: DUF1330 domain-containing protein [Rhodocyclaceae bacterium]|nr:MAG: DUF1330 domain-containing protein [Rhodocyclaceae bacterium]